MVVYSSAPLFGNHLWQKCKILLYSTFPIAPIPPSSCPLFLLLHRSLLINLLSPPCQCVLSCVLPVFHYFTISSSSSFSLPPSLFLLHALPSLKMPAEWFVCLSHFSSNAARAALHPTASGAASVYPLLGRLRAGKTRKLWVQRHTQENGMVHGSSFSCAVSHVL